MKCVKKAESNNLFLQNNFEHPTCVLPSKKSFNLYQFWGSFKWMIDKFWILSHTVQQWKYDGEGDTTLFCFWHFFLFELISLFIYEWFPNGLKPRRISNFVINWFSNCQELEERETEKHNFRTIFSFFKFFKLLKIWKYNLVST